MYLLTFSFLIIAMLGIYAQVVAVEAARLYQSQTGIAQSMIYWHEAAASLAGNVVNPVTTPMGTTGCLLTSTATSWPYPPPAQCISGPNVLPASSPVTMPTTTPWNTYTYPTTPAASIVIYPNLPSGYSIGAYQWKSIAYQSGIYYYVVTYADPPAAGGLISDATAQLGITQSDLFQQIKNIGIPINAYGYVTNTSPGVSPGTLNTFAILPGSTSAITYLVPQSIPNGALAIISAPGQCIGC